MTSPTQNYSNGSQVETSPTFQTTSFPGNLLNFTPPDLTSLYTPRHTGNLQGKVSLPVSIPKRDEVNGVTKAKACALSSMLWIGTFAVLTTVIATVGLALTILSAAIAGAAMGSAAGPIASVLGLGVGTLIGIGLAVSAIVLAVAILVDKYQSSKKLESFQGEIEKARIEALAKAATQPLGSGVQNHSIAGKTKDALISEMEQHVQGSQKGEIQSFVEGVLALRDEIEQLSESNPKRGSIDQLREKLSKLLLSRPYQALKRENTTVSVEYLKEVSLKMISGDGQGAIQRYGEKLKEERKTAYGVTENVTNCAHLGLAIEAELGMSNYKRDSIFSKACWLLSHPANLVHSRIAKTAPLAFNSHKGNGDYFGFNLPLHKNNSIQFYYGPCQTGDPIYEHGVLPAYEKYKEKEVRFNYQSSHNTHELTRGIELHRLATNNDQLVVITMPFDAKRSKRGKELFKETTPENFMKKFTSQIKREARSPVDDKDAPRLGYYIPPQALDNEKLAKSLSIATKIAESLNASVYAQTLSEEERKELMKMSTDVVLHIPILQKVKPNRVSAACKEDIDRGPPMNLLMRMYAEMVEQDAGSFSHWLEANSAELIAGMVGRGRHGDQDRNGQMSRARILINLLKCMGSIQRTEIQQQLKKLAE